jgi:hypothetical protein
MMAMRRSSCLPKQQLLTLSTSASKQKTFKHLYKLAQAVKAQNLTIQQAMSENQQDLSLFCPTSLARKVARLKTSEAHKISERSQDDNYDIGIYVK